MNIEQSSVQGRLTFGLNTAVGTTRIQLTDSRPLVRGVTLKAVTGNAGVIYVGGPEVTTTNGWPLPVNETLFLPVGDMSQIFVVASQSSQSLSWIGI